MARPERHSALLTVSRPARVYGADTPALGSGRIARGTPVPAVSIDRLADPLLSQDSGAVGESWQMP